MYGVATTPSPVRRYLVEIEQRRERLTRLRAQAIELGQEIAKADYALSEAHRDFREVQRKWLGAQLLARRLKDLKRGPREAGPLSAYSAIEEALTAAARELGVSPREVLQTV